MLATRCIGARQYGAWPSNTHCSSRSASNPPSGLDLARRFGRSIGFFWSATHQQIYRVLGRMDADGWVTVTEVPQAGKPDKKVYAVSPAGRRVLAAWLAEPTESQPLRSELAVKLRGASFADDREAVLGVVAGQPGRPRHPARALPAHGRPRLPRARHP